jgi:hypothetical protein
MTETISRWNVGEKFTEALTEAASSREVIKAAMTPVGKAMEEAFSALCDDIIDRMPDALSDELRYRTDKIIEALLAGDEKLLGSFMAAGGHREPHVDWDGTFRSGYWVEVRRRIVETNERIADLTAERDAIAAQLKAKTADLGRLRGELAETSEALHWAKVRLGDAS